MGKILRKCYANHEAQFQELSVFVGQKSILRHYRYQVLKMEVNFEYTR